MLVQHRGPAVGHQRAEATALRRDGRVAVRANLQDLDHQRVARLGAFDRDRPDLARPLAAGALVPLAPERLALQHVAGLDRQHRRPRREGRMAQRRPQAVRLGARLQGQREGGDGEHERRDRAGVGTARGTKRQQAWDLPDRACGFYAAPRKPGPNTARIARHAEHQRRVPCRPSRGRARPRRGGARAPPARAAERTLLAIGAHAGDVENSSGAILARHKRLGDRVVILHLTLGEGGNPRLAPAVYGEQKKREALAAAKALGAEVIFGPYRDGQLPEGEEAVRFVADVIREVRPTHVITHWRRSIHRDHEATHRVVREALLAASLEGYASTLPRHRGVRGVYYAENWEDAEEFRPYLYVDVSEDLAGLEGGGELATSSSAAGSRRSPISSTTSRSRACAVPRRASASPSASTSTRSRRSG